MSASFVYILRCRDGSFYTGWTNDVEKRVLAHQAGTGGRYTRSRLPVALVYTEEVSSAAEARRREWAVKQLSRAAKMALVRAQSSSGDPSTSSGSR